jgi:hypothetical protein
MLTVEQRRALTLLAELPAGLTDWLLRANGVGAAVLADLINTGLIAARPQFVDSGDGPPLPIMRVTITPAGREAL